MSDSHVCRVPVFIVVSVMSLIWFSPGHTELFRPGGTGKDAQPARWRPSSCVAGIIVL